MSAHSPGPWRQFKNAIVDARDCDVASMATVVGKPWDTGIADARLIAAAPELLAALKTVVAAFPDRFQRWEALIRRIESAT